METQQHQIKAGETLHNFNILLVKNKKIVTQPINEFHKSFFMDKSDWMLVDLYLFDVNMGLTLM